MPRPIITTACTERTPPTTSWNRTRGHYCSVWNDLTQTWDSLTVTWDGMCTTGLESNWNTPRYGAYLEDLSGANVFDLSGTEVFALQGLTNKIDTNWN